MSALRVTPLAAVGVTQFFGDDTDSWTQFDSIRHIGGHTQPMRTGNRPPKCGRTLPNVRGWYQLPCSLSFGIQAKR